MVPSMTEPETKPYMVFISHASSALELFIATALAMALKILGAEVWLDIADGVRGGDPIRKRVVEAIANCDEAIVLLSSRSVESDWVIWEIGVIDGKNKRFTPVLVDITQKEVPKIVSDLRSVDIGELAINEKNTGFWREFRERVNERTHVGSC